MYNLKRNCQVEAPATASRSEKSGTPSTQDPLSRAAWHRTLPFPPGGPLSDPNSGENNVLALKKGF